MLMTSTQSAPSVAAEPTMNTPRTSAKTTGWICGDTNSSGNGSSTSAYPADAKLIVKEEVPDAQT